MCGDVRVSTWWMPRKPSGISHQDVANTTTAVGIGIAEEYLGLKGWNYH